MANPNTPPDPSFRARLAKAPFADAVFFCGKCARRFPDGSKAVRKTLKAELKSRRWGKVRLVETKCFDLCPKRRQVLASTHTLDRRRLLVVEPGFSPAAALTELLGPPRDAAHAVDEALAPAGQPEQRGRTAQPE